MRTSYRWKRCPMCGSTQVKKDQSYPDEFNARACAECGASARDWNAIWAHVRIEHLMRQVKEKDELIEKLKGKKADELLGEENKRLWAAIQVIRDTAGSFDWSPFTGLKEIIRQSQNILNSRRRQGDNENNLHKRADV